jgi:hypothetical protein
MYRSNGLIDDFVLYGEPGDYLSFASRVEAAIHSRGPETFRTESQIQIEISITDRYRVLWTALENEDNFYPSIDAWNRRDILRVAGSPEILEKLRCFLVDLSGRGLGYSYISEFCEDSPYSADSPEWRLHVQVP